MQQIAWKRKKIHFEWKKNEPQTGKRWPRGKHLSLFFVRNIENNLDYIENNLESLSTIDGNQIKALIFPMIGIDYYI